MGKLDELTKKYLENYKMAIPSILLMYCIVRESGSMGSSGVSLNSV
jgi:hypothetical protein